MTTTFFDRLWDLQDRSCCNNLRINTKDEVENGLWEQTEVIFQNLFDKKLKSTNIKIARANRIGNKQKSKKIIMVTKFASFSDKQKVLSETQKLRGSKININEA